jgi:hypothetical protein
MAVVMQIPLEGAVDEKVSPRCSNHVLINGFGLPCLADTDVPRHGHRGPAPNACVAASEGEVRPQESCFRTWLWGELPAQARGLISCSTCRPRPPARRSQSRASRIARAEASRSPSLAAIRACLFRVAAWSSRRWRAPVSDSGETLERERVGEPNVKLTGGDGLETIMTGEDVAPSKTFTTGQLASNSPIWF